MDAGADGEGDEDGVFMEADGEVASKSISSETVACSLCTAPWCLLARGCRRDCVCVCACACTETTFWCAERGADSGGDTFVWDW